jgi:hypothetical protein
MKACSVFREGFFDVGDDGGGLSVCSGCGLGGWSVGGGGALRLLDMRNGRSRTMGLMTETLAVASGCFRDRGRRLESWWRAGFAILREAVLDNGCCS